MMFKKISLIASMLFFLLGTNVFAQSTQKAATVEPSIKDYVVPGAVALLFVIGCSSYWLVYRRKHNNYKA